MKNVTAGIAILLLFYLFVCTPPQPKREPAPQAVGTQEAIRHLRICSQNVQRYSERNRHWSKKKQRKQLRYLVRRMKRAKCDIIALQEVAGKSRRVASAVVEEIAASLAKKTGYSYSSILAGSRDRYIRNAMIYRNDVVVAHEIIELSQLPLPRLQHLRGKTTSFSRGPLLVRFGVKSEEGQVQFLVATMHFKSKRAGYRDSTGTDFEIMRMEMAEGLRKEVLRRLQDYSPGVVPLILGDRNSAPESASAQILSGERTLEAFRRGSCELTQKEKVRCEEDGREDAEFVGLFALRRAKQRQEFGSHLYRGKQSLIDEILIRPLELQAVTRSNGSYAIGLEGKFFKGSDHKLLWVELDVAKLGQK